MAYQLTLAVGLSQATLAVPESLVAQAAIETIMALSDPAMDLATRGWLAGSDTAVMTRIQATLFDRDAQGFFVRDGIDLQGPRGGIDPDQPLLAAFLPDAQGQPTLTLTIIAPGATLSAPAPAPETPQAEAHEQMAAYQVLFVRHRIGQGTLIDVTKDDPFLARALAQLEKNREIEINVDTASWQLTATGTAQLERQKQEALDLIRRYDIFADVDARSGDPAFGSGLGDDWRVPIYELAGVDPYRARFLLGLNDGEWDVLPEWTEHIADEAWYEAIFAPISDAPAIEDLGRPRLEGVLQAGTTVVRETLAEEREFGLDPSSDRIPNPYRDGTL